jgi:TRAP-type C4-dicarboxylate transport system permease small subunit
MHALRKWLGRVDTGIYQVERVLLVISLVMMTLLVFSEVIVRTFTRPVGKTASILIALLGIDDPETAKQVADVWGPVLFHLMFAGLCVFGAHSSRQIIAERAEAEAPAVGRSAIVGIVVYGALFGGIQVMTWLFPTGVAGAQRFSLGFMVWAGLLGASIATRTGRHIVLDAVKKKLDDQVAPLFSLLGAIATALFTGTLAWLSAFKFHEQFSEWSENPNIGVFDALPIPEWTVTLALPLTFGMIALRFLFAGVSDLLYGESLIATEDEHGVNLAELEAAAAAAEEQEEHEMPSMIYGRPHLAADAGGAES